MDTPRVMVLAFQVSIMLTVFGFGLRVTVADVLSVVRRPRILVISLVSMFIVMPFIALVLAVVIDPPRVALVALVALALSPVPPTLLGKEPDAGGRTSYGLGLTVTVSILSIVLVPALVPFLGSLTDQPFNIGFAAVAGQVLVSVVLLLLAAAVFLLIAGFPQFMEVLNISTVAAFVVFTVLGLAFGHIMAGPAPEDARVLALASALRHPGIALAITAVNFPSLQFGAVIILYLLIGAIVSIPYVKWMQKRTPDLQIPGRQE